MDLHAEINYPGATSEQAYALVVDPEFRVAVCEATRALDQTVDVVVRDGGASVKVERTMPAEVPDFVKKFVGDTVDVVQTEEWGTPDERGQRQADLVVEIKGKPAKMTGTIVLEVTGDGVREVVTGELKVTVPFVGKKIEPEIAKGILAAVRKEEKTGQAWLSST